MTVVCDRCRCHMESAAAVHRAVYFSIPHDPAQVIGVMLCRGCSDALNRCMEEFIRAPSIDAALQPMVDAMAAEARELFDGTRPVVYRPLARVVTPEVRFPPLVPEGDRA